MGDPGSSIVQLSSSVRQLTYHQLTSGAQTKYHAWPSKHGCTIRYRVVLYAMGEGAVELRISCTALPICVNRYAASSHSVWSSGSSNNENSHTHTHTLTNGTPIQVTVSAERRSSTNKARRKEPAAQPSSSCLDTSATARVDWAL